MGKKKIVSYRRDGIKTKVVPFFDAELDELNEFASKNIISANELCKVAALERIRGEHVKLPKDAIIEAIGKENYILMQTAMIKDFVGKIMNDIAPSSQQI